MNTTGCPVGIAMRSASDTALATALVVIQDGGAGKVAAAQRLAKRTRRVMKQNLGWALANNLAALPLAMAGTVTPTVTPVATE